MQHLSFLLALCAAVASASPSPTPAPGSGSQGSVQHKRTRIDARDGQGISIPLLRRDRPRPFRKGKLSSKELAELDYVTDVDALQRARDALVDKYAEGRGPDVVKRLHEKRIARDSRARALDAKNRKRDVKTVPISNHNFDTTYSGVVSLGTPPQQFEVLLDTGSSDTWITSNNCSCTSTNCQACSYGSSWDSSTSSSWSQRGKILNIQYGSGAVSGRTGKDVVELGGYTISDQVIGVVDQAQRILPGSIEGLMGLAFGLIAKAGGTPWWLRVLAGEASGSGGTPDTPLMSFWLSRYVDSADTAPIHPGGQFIIGGTNSSFYTGDINYIDVVQPAKWWLIPIAIVGLEGGPSIDVTEGHRNSIIDTGTTLVGGQDTVLAEIYANITGAVKASDLSLQLTGFYALPCDSSAKITFTFNGITYEYSTVDLLYQRIDDLKPNYCLSSLFVFSSADTHSINYTPPGSPYWLVGDSFLKNVYSVFTLGSGGSGDAGIQGMGNNGASAQVGFAKLSGTNGEVGTAADPGNSTVTATTLTVKGPHAASTDLPVGVIPDVDTTVVVVVTATADPTPAGSGAGPTAADGTIFTSIVAGLGMSLLLFSTW